MSRQENKQNNGEKGGNKSVVIVGIIAVIIIAVLVGVIVFLLKPQEEAKRNVVVNEENVEEVIQEIVQNSETTAPGTLGVKMNGIWNFENGTATSKNAYVENPVRNTNDVYFDIILADTEETIYESPILPVGSHLENISLDKDLEAGTYDCVIIYHVVDENQKSLSTVRLTLKVVIEN